MSKKNRQMKTYDDVRDLSIEIIEYLIKELSWEVDDIPESQWYPFNLQDGITELIQEHTGIKDCKGEGKK